MLNELVERAVEFGKNEKCHLDYALLQVIDQASDNDIKSAVYQAEGNDPDSDYIMVVEKGITVERRKGILNQVIFEVAKKLLRKKEKNLRLFVEG